MSAGGSPLGSSGSAALPFEFMGLEHKSLEELEEIMNDERAFEEFFTSIPHVREQQKNRREFLAGNEALARQNMSKEAELTRLRESLAEQQRIFQAHRQEFDVNLRTQKDLMMKYAPDYIISRMRTSVAESEELSETMASSFLEGKVSVDDFLKNYKELRKVYHQRAFRVERVVRDPNLLT